MMRSFKLVKMRDEYDGTRKNVHYRLY